MKLNIFRGFNYNLNVIVFFFFKKKKLKLVFQLLMFLNTDFKRYVFLFQYFIEFNGQV